MSKPYLYDTLAVIGLFVLFYFIVKIKRQTNSNPLHIIDLYMEEEGFVDLTLSLTSRRSSKGMQALIAEGLYQETKVGFKVLIDPSHSDQINIQSIGNESDHFVRALSERYGFEGTPSRMKKEIIFTSFVLEGNGKTSKIKLFYDDETEENYAECYLNIDVPARKVEWFEKDPEYREALLRALSA